MKKATFFLLALTSYGAEGSWTISAQPVEIFQGGIVEIRVSGKDLAAVKGLLRNQEIAFFPGETGSYSALLGVDLEEKPGTLEIVLQGLEKGGEKRDGLLVLRVREKMFPKENLSVPAGFDRIDESLRKRIEKEQAALTRLWAVSSPRRSWEGRFVPPVSGAVTSPFGLRRVINGLERSPHGGVDLKASLGTEVVAANHGRVVLRDEFFFSGKSIVLDHGGGLYTMYFHLADFNVDAGSQVRKGDSIGRAGMSGRATGPHLHWGARLNGARVDPLELLNLNTAISSQRSALSPELKAGR